MRRSGLKARVGNSTKGNTVGERCSSEKNKCNLRSKKDIGSLRLQRNCNTCTSSERTLTTCSPRVDDIFPSWLPWILFPLTFLLRVLYIQQPKNWWILHPDEIFQTIEVAHSDAFGYGFRPYEYLAPPPENVANSTLLSSAHVQKIQYGMYSLRSFILPKIIASAIVIANWCGVKTSSFLIVKVFHAIITSLLPVVIFQFSQTLHHSRDIGCLSAILVSSSLTLNVLGTHTLINSFLAPVFFLCLTPLVGSLRSFKDIFETNQSEIKIVSNGTSTKEIKSSDNNDASESSLYNEDFQQNEHHTPSSFILESKPNFSSHDENANIILHKDDFHNKYDFKFNNRRFTIFKKIASVTSYGCVTKSKIRSKENEKKKDIHEMLVGMGLVLCIYIRFDLVLIPVLLLFGSYSLLLTNVSVSIVYFKYYSCGISLGLMIGGYCDYATYGKWFLAPYQWYKFNVRNNFAGKIFGINSFHFYLLKLYQNEPLIVFSFVILLIQIVYMIGWLFTMPMKRNALAKGRSIVTFTFLLLAFSCNTHKELRFLHNAVIFLYISVSVAILSVVKNFSQNQNRRKYLHCSIYLFIAVFTSSHCYNFVNMGIADRAKWTYGNITDSHETNMCLDFIRQQRDVNGVFMDRSVYMSGAYSIIQHDVPMFALNIYEFMEYRKNCSQNNCLSIQEKNTFLTFTDISDFISVFNSQYMYKKIWQTPEYNFLIIKTNNHNFDTEGYVEKFRVGNSKVLKRNFEKKFFNFATDNENEKIVWNATILEYEGDWLRHYGLYTKAEHRLIMANRIDHKRIGTFRVLLEMYSKLRQTGDYRSVLEACLQVYRKTECLKAYDPIELHPGYYRMRT